MAGFHNDLPVSGGFCLRCELVREFTGVVDRGMRKKVMTMRWEEAVLGFVVEHNSNGRSGTPRLFDSAELTE